MMQRRNKKVRLLVCIGNTRTRVCLQAGRLSQIASFPTGERHYDQLAGSVLKGIMPDIACIGIVSVVPWADSAWIRACKKKGLLGPLFLTARNIERTVMAVKYRPISALGADRASAALGAIALSPHRNRIVVDAGTAVTVDAITRDNTFQGGFIFPGPDLTMKALSAGTALLPDFKWKSSGPAVGRSTQECMNQGVLNMFRGGVTACIEALKRDLHLTNPVLHITGGAAKALQIPKKPYEVVIEPDLVLTGLEYWLSGPSNRCSC